MYLLKHREELVMIWVCVGAQKIICSSITSRDNIVKEVRRMII